MPHYDYECLDCGYTFEVFQNMSEDPLKICPACGKEVRRVISGGTGIIFKGSGFYVTDNKKSSTSVKDPVAKKGNDTGTTDTKEKSENKEKSSDKDTKPKSTAEKAVAS